MFGRRAASFTLAVILATQAQASTAPSANATGTVSLTGPTTARIGETLQWSLLARVTPGQKTSNGYSYEANPSYDYVDFLGTMDFGDGTQQNISLRSSEQINIICSSTVETDPSGAPIPGITCPTEYIEFELDVPAIYATVGLFKPSISGNFKFSEERLETRSLRVCDELFPGGPEMCFFVPQDVLVEVEVDSVAFATSAASVEVSAVPVPAALPLLLGGLGALAFGRRRHRQALLA